MRDLVDGLYERTRQFATEIEQAGFSVLNDVVFNQVLVVCENDDITGRTLELIQKSGECWCGGAQWGGRKVIRVSVSSWVTTPEDISQSVRAFVNAHQEVKLVGNIAR